MVQRLLQRARQALCGIAQLLVPLAAQAQVDSRINKNLTYAKDLAVGACVVIFTAMLIYAGIEIAARHKRILDVWPILVGAGIAGSAALMATYFVS